MSIVPEKVFLSYCHADEWLKDELIETLDPLVRNKSIEIWHDRLIQAGADFDAEIKSKLDSSDIMILLVSPAFVASSYCVDVEFKFAKHKRAKSEMKIIPVLVRQSSIEIEGLEKIQIIPPDLQPVNGVGVSRAEREKRDHMWNVVFEQFKAVTEAQKKTL
jgi:hypothetical protein